ncbi:hypothetical protein HIM_01331 [Hirsutella minnesotensis 3608]|nr:hypothetical protein HIM_01331 [Hirsutella minnesotensis 3608]
MVRLSSAAIITFAALTLGAYQAPPPQNGVGSSFVAGVRRAPAPFRGQLVRRQGEIGSNQTAPATGKNPAVDTRIQELTKLVEENKQKADEDEKNGNKGQADALRAQSKMYEQQMNDLRKAQ